MRGLTSLQQELLDYIRKYHREHYPRVPSIREMCKHFRRAIHSIDGRLKQLVKKGYLTATTGSPKARAYTVVVWESLLLVRMEDLQ